MGQVRIPEEKQRQIVTLRAEGYPYAKIAELAGVAKTTAVEECRRKDKTIQALRTLATEALFDEFGLSARERARHRAEMLSRMRDEISRRDLSDIPTAKLIELYSRQLDDLEERERGEERLKAQGDNSDAKELIRARAEEIKGLLTAEGKYTEELQLQVLLAAQLSIRTEELAAEVLAGDSATTGEERKNPAEELFLSYAERTQRALKALGMNTEARERNAEGAGDPLLELYQKMAQIGD